MVRADPLTSQRSVVPAAILLLFFVPIPCTAQTEVPDDQIAETSRTPMYGQPEVRRPKELALADSVLVKGMLEEIPDRRAASNTFWYYGEDYLIQGKLNLAMSRYNHAWLMDRSNYQPFWGFGRVLLAKNQTAEAIKHLEEAWRLCQQPEPNVAVLATLATACSMHAARLEGTLDQRNRYRALANKQFDQCVTIDPAYADGWLQWARALEREARYADAWMKVARARELGTDLPLAFLEELGRRMPEPKKP